MKNMNENIKTAIETAVGGRKNLEHEDYERIGIEADELDVLKEVYIYRQYQITIIADVLISYPSLIKQLVKLRKEKHINEVALATTVDIQKPFIKETGKCAYLYIV